MNIFLDISYKVHEIEVVEKNFLQRLYFFLGSTANRNKIKKIQELTLIFKGLLSQLENFTFVEAENEYLKSNQYFQKLIKQEEKSNSPELKIALSECLDIVMLYNSRLKKIVKQKKQKSDLDSELENMLVRKNKSVILSKL